MHEHHRQKTRLEPPGKLPRLERLSGGKEGSLRALEKTFSELNVERDASAGTGPDLHGPADRLVAMQRLSDIISSSVEPELIVSTLIELSRQVIPVVASNVFFFREGGGRLQPLSSKGSDRLQREVERQMEAGIIDWVIAEKKTVVIPDLERTLASGSSRNFVLVPLLLCNKGVGVYLIHTEQPRQEISRRDIQLLTILANQAAAGVENWRTRKELVRANEELKASQAQMMQAAKLAAIGELAASVAHEIKNPLQVMMMNLELVRSGNQLPNWLDMFGKQVKRLSEITIRLMNFAKNVSEDAPQEPTDVNKALEDIVAIVQHEFRGNGIEIGMTLADSLPRVQGNANQLQQVFLNLLINARDAMPSGGRISIATAHTGYHLSIRFADTGTGMEKGVLGKIFDPFFTTKGEKGTGLGLAVCHKIVLQHRGEIKVESEYGVGSAFTIFLPIWRATK